MIIAVPDQLSPLARTENKSLLCRRGELFRLEFNWRMRPKINMWGGAIIAALADFLACIKVRCWPKAASPAEGPHRMERGPTIRAFAINRMRFSRAAMRHREWAIFERKLSW
ncbi:hypothetical protein CU103_17175 [Phyllobacterium sophorae]|uniref:Uncharacterized protein n=1 Tax=Phyllobacterium sophorae TaxID=1520277 RepID=A0A2P7B878_9HYPH|nr:hypothetical protein CU103_17175 [Phyllobacterium sophorae]